MDTPADTQKIAAIEYRIRKILMDDEDSVQDVLLQLIKRRHAIRDPEHYALRAAKHLKWRRRRESKRTLPEGYRATTASRRVVGPEEEAVQQEQLESLASAIATLPSSQRAAVEDRLTGPLANSQRQWRSQAMRNSAAYRAIKTLRRKLTHEGETRQSYILPTSGRATTGDTTSSVEKTAAMRRPCNILAAGHNSRQ